MVCCVVCLPAAVMFALFSMQNVVAWAEGSSTAVSFLWILCLLVLWFGVSSPLVFVGSYFGLKKDTISVPVRTNQIARCGSPLQGMGEGVALMCDVWWWGGGQAYPRADVVHAPPVLHRPGRDPALWCSMHRALLHHVGIMAAPDLLCLRYVARVALQAVGPGQLTGISGRQGS
jgi:hypothetical protein